MKRTMTKMKITKSQLKHIIKEEISKILKENSPNLPAETTVTTRDGIKHRLKVTDVESGYYGDTAQGGFYYEIDGEEHEWEFHSGYYAPGAAMAIMDALDEEYSEELEDQIVAWLEKLNISTF